MTRCLHRSSYPSNRLLSFSSGTCNLDPRHQERNSFAATNSKAPQLHSRPILSSVPHLPDRGSRFDSSFQSRFVCYCCPFQHGSCNLAGSVLSTPKIEPSERRPFLSIFGFIDSSYIECAIDSTTTSLYSTTRCPSPLRWPPAKSIPRWTVQTSFWNARARKLSLVSLEGKGVSYSFHGIISPTIGAFHWSSVYCPNGARLPVKTLDSLLLRPQRELAQSS